MPTLEIDGVGRVQVDDSFRSLSAADQEKTVGEITSSLRGQKQETPQTASDSKISSISDLGSAIAKDFRNPPNELSLVGMAGRAWKAFTDPIPDPENKEAFANRALDIAMTASPLSAGSALRRAPGLAATAAPKKMPAPSVSELKAAASEGYNSPEVANLSVKAPALQTWSQDIRTRLTDAGLDENVAPKTWGILNKVDKAPVGAFVTGKNLDSLRKTFGNAAGTVEPAERKAAMEAIDALDEFLPKTPKESVLAGDPEKAASILEEARGNYSAAAHAQTIDKKQYKAETRAAAANSGMNAGNTMRQRVADILVNDKERRGFSPEAIAQMERVVNGEGGANAARMASNIMGGGGGVVAGGYGVTGALASNPAVAAIPIVGWGLRKLSNAMTAREIGKLNEIIRADSPLGRKVNAPFLDWQRRAQEFESAPSMKAYSLMAVSARNLANNLKDAGISISQAHLMKIMQGPVAGRSENEQP